MLKAPKYLFVLGILGLFLCLIKCTYLSPQVNLDIAVPPFQKLSEYNLFLGNMADLTPNEGLIPFEPITPLFSDYAEKLRFVWMPEGESAIYHDSETFNFPLSAVLIKNFYFPNDFRDETKGRRIMETRLLVNREDGWDALAYIWNDEQTEAFLEIAGGIKQVEWINGEGEKVNSPYVIPNKNQCKGCHVVDRKLLPIGPKARNINSSIDYREGKMNQLEKWKSMGYLKSCPDHENAPKIAKWDDSTSGTLEERALAYMELNCGTCHNRKGPAHTTGLYLTSFENEPAHLGICKSPVAAGQGSGGRLYDIVPGDPDASILVFRMESTDAAVMMPEMGRKLVHKEGVALIREWIQSIKYSCDPN